MRNASRLGALVLIGAPTVALAADPPKPADKPPAEAPAIDPHAQQVLRDMSSYLSSLKDFRGVNQAVDELVLTNGSKIQDLSSSQISVHRPNAFRSEQVGPDARLTAWYDGKTLSVYCKSNNTYGTVAAPPTIDATLDLGRKQYGIEAPASDLIFANAYDVLMEGAKTGQYLGLENVGGVQAQHIAFQEEEVDWQLWVEDGPTPLPLRYVVTTKTMPSQPQFTAVLTHWETQANLPADTFAFHPPPGAKRVDGLPSKCPAAATK